VVGPFSSPLQDVEVEAELRELELQALELARRAGRLLSAVLRRPPLGVPHVHDEPAVAGGCEACAEVLEPRLWHGRESNVGLRFTRPRRATYQL
jgi:hypothetical protein